MASPQTYQYGTIQDLVAKMQSYASKADQMVQEITQTGTALINNGSWSGQSADDYTTRRTRIQGELTSAQQAVTALSGKTGEGAQAMQEADRKGGATIGT